MFLSQAHAAHSRRGHMELVGLEPTTSSLQSLHSPIELQPRYSPIIALYGGRKSRTPWCYPRAG